MQALLFLFLLVLLVLLQKANQTKSRRLSSVQHQFLQNISHTRAGPELSHPISPPQLLSFLLLPPHRRPTSSMPHIATPTQHSLRRGRGRVDGRPDVEVKYRLTRRLGISRVIVDHVADLFGGACGCAAGDVPVVAVEGGFAAGRTRVSHRSISACSASGERGREGKYPNFVGQT
jgi:hypothetical protein